jgi:biopolymer transport protein ExbB
MMEMNLFQIFLKGGPMMWLILLCSVMALAITIERISYYALASQDAGQLRKDLFDALKRGDREGALRLCDATRSLAGRIFRAGLMQSGDSREEIVQAMEREALIQTRHLEKWLPALSTIANISPLLGFLGTALGLASSFFWVQSNATSLHSVSLSYFSSGIWQALLTTIFGLFVGISAALVYNACVIWVNRTVLRLEEEATKLIDLLSYLSDVTPNQDEGLELSQEP